MDQVPFCASRAYETRYGCELLFIVGKTNSELERYVKFLIRFPRCALEQRYYNYEVTKVY